MSKRYIIDEAGARQIRNTVRKVERLQRPLHRRRVVASGGGGMNGSTTYGLRCVSSAGAVTANMLPTGPYWEKGNYFRVHGVAVDGDGDLYTYGAHMAAAEPYWQLSKWSADGSRVLWRHRFAWVPAAYPYRQMVYDPVFDRLYLSALQETLPDNTLKSVWAIDANTGDLLWTFDTGHTAWACDVDAFGNLYVVGTRTNDWAGSGGTTACLWKLDRNGSVLWSYDGQSQAYGVRAGANGVFICGASLKDASSNDRAIQRIDSSGVYQDGADLAAQYAYGIAIDSVGDVYVVGRSDDGAVALWALSGSNLSNTRWTKGAGGGWLTNVAVDANDAICVGSSGETYLEGVSGPVVAYTRSGVFSWTLDLKLGAQQARPNYATYALETWPDKPGFIVCGYEPY